MKRNSNKVSISNGKDHSCMKKNSASKYYRYSQKWSPKQQGDDKRKMK